MAPDSSSVSLLVMLACSAAQLAAGLAIGWKLGRSQTKSAAAPPPPPPPAGPITAAATTAAPLPTATLDPDQAQILLSRLHELASGVSDDIGQHNSSVRAFGSELASLSSLDQGSLQGIVLKAVATMHEANTQLQGQLAEAATKIQEQKKQIEVRVAEARTDALTGLANRRAFDDELGRRLAQFRRQRTHVALLMLDIDHFKRFNDTHGHQAGDEVLRGVARVLARTVADAGLAARFGGEEFVVILPGGTLQEARQLACRVRTAIAASTFHFAGADLKVTASLGLGIVGEQDDTASIVKRTDEALYASKKGGRNCAHLHDGQACQRIEDVTAASSSSAPVATASTSAGNDSASRQAEPLADMLTRLPNRRAFLDDLARRVAERRRTAAPLSLVLVEVDRLSQVRTSRGRLAGDLMLRATAQFLTAALRDMDVVARYSDAQFGVLLPGTDYANAQRVAERVRSAIAACRSLDLEGQELTFTVSVGVTKALSGDDSHSLIERATAAVHTAIHAGRNCIRSLPEETLSVPQAEVPAASC